LLAQSGLRPKKRFGQNFLVNPASARRIARLSLEGAPPSPRVVEIGAGTGTLTRALLEEGAQLTAIEIDPELVAILLAREDLTGTTIVRDDALCFDYTAWSGEAPWRVAGNLPYNVATPLLLRLIEMRGGPESLTVMVQRDVARRFAAIPATPAYGSLSVAVQYAMHVEQCFSLAPNSFFPAPKVRSTVVRLTRREHPAAAPRDPVLFWKVVRGAFAYRRKTLVNSLAIALALDRAAIVRALIRCNLSTEIRGERLDLGDFARLADALAEG
jgi:16S rRNA (adenine1518-N6/adenine1519-N6)-dimethyltransferase